MDFREREETLEPMEQRAQRAQREREVPMEILASRAFPELLDHQETGERRETRENKDELVTKEPQDTKASAEILDRLGLKVRMEYVGQPVNKETRENWVQLGLSVPRAPRATKVARENRGNRVLTVLPANLASRGSLAWRAHQERAEDRAFLVTLEWLETLDHREHVVPTELMDKMESTVFPVLWETQVWLDRRVPSGIWVRLDPLA